MGGADQHSFLHQNCASLGGWVLEKMFFSYPLMLASLPKPLRGTHAAKCGGKYNGSLHHLLAVTMVCRTIWDLGKSTLWGPLWRTGVEWPLTGRWWDFCGFLLKCFDINTEDGLSFDYIFGNENLLEKIEDDKLWNF